MANIINDEMMKLDSTGIVGADALQEYRLVSVVWTADEASGRDIASNDDFLLLDGENNEIHGKRAAFSGDDYGFVYPEPRVVKGLNVSKLDGGIIRIHLYKR